MAETRKLAAILAGDVADYSKLASAGADACGRRRAPHCIGVRNWREMVRALGSLIRARPLQLIYLEGIDNGRQL
jgi:hypothetical protein